MAVKNSREPTPLLRQACPQVQFRAGPLFFGILDLVLEGGGEAVAEELAAVLQEKGFARIQNTAQGSLLGRGFQLGGQVQSHLGNLTLK